MVLVFSAARTQYELLTTEVYLFMVLDAGKTTAMTDVEDRSRHAAEFILFNQEATPTARHESIHEKT